MENNINWPDSMWKEIHEAVLREVAKVRIAQKIFPTTVFNNDPIEIINDVIVFST